MYDLLQIKQQKDRYSMEYEIVQLKEKIITGLCERTSNSDPKMGELIGGLWGKLYEGKIINKIKNRANEYSYGLYSDYQKDGSYKVTIGCEVTNKAECDKDDLSTTIVPAGKYARFKIHGDMVKAVGQAWSDIWEMDLKRTWTGDFEEYVDSNMTGEATIYIYIAIE